MTAALRRQRCALRVIMLIAVVSIALVLNMVRAAPAHAGESDPKAVAIAKEMIVAHGGFERWRSAPTVSFEDQWEGRERAMLVTVNQRTRQAYLDVVGSDGCIVWDGEKAWSVNWEGTPPRFLALLNYYFANLPWLTMDPGVNLNGLGTASLWDDPVEYITLRMTFDEGVGDTPDDYYVLHIDPKTKMLKATTYIVTYGGVLPEGVTRSPEHILVYDSWADVDGLKVPTHFTIYQLDHTLYAKCAFRNWSFEKPFDNSRLTMPSTAVIDESQP
jgi:hypothetical protein